MLTSYVRTLVVYLVLIVVVRLMGKRQIGQMEPSEFVVTMFVANLASILVENTDLPMYAGLIPIAVVLGVELVLAGLCLRSICIRKMLCGKPVILIENGRILQENLRKTRVTIDELTGHLREKDILDLKSVQYAILETNGNLSVFPFPKDMPATAGDAGIAVKRQYFPVTVVSDGKLLKENLAVAGKDRRWVEKVLRQKDATLEDTWLLTVDGSDRIVFYRRENRCG